MFVRWAIELDCPLREIRPERLPETTFRQLRAIRELSLARMQRRVQAGFCLHPSNRKESPEKALGFSVDEVVNLFGGMQAVDDRCQGCRANAGAELDKNFWAGCFGIVAADLRWNLDDIIRGQLTSAEDQSSLPCRGLADAKLQESSIENVEASEFDLPRIVNRVSAQQSPGNAVAHSDDELPCWVKLWKERVPGSGQLLLLEQTFERVLEDLDSNFAQSADVQSAVCGAPLKAGGDCSAPLKPNASSTGGTARSEFNFEPHTTRDSRQFLQAIRRCRRHELSLHVELVPAGFSDGLHWRLQPHCQVCKQTWLDPLQSCLICGADGKYQNEIKLKVLGLRPYLKLAEMIGLAETKRILEQL
jgi:hypothetical protein